ncbi:MAG: tetratricopeptide repeat protein [Myxococcales bacterium]|nr:tetratricopeptide repeat protein [Myxococcales bacterium]
MNRSRWIPVLVLGCAALIWSPPARADVAAAKVAFKKGEAAYADGRFGEALGHYLEAFKQKPLNGFHFNLGLCYRKLGKHEEAIKHFKAYLGGSTSESNRARAIALIKLSEVDAKAARDRERRLRDVAPPKQPPPKTNTGDIAAKGPDQRKPPKKRVDGDDDKPRRGLSPALFWTGAAVTAALAVIGSVTGGVALSKASTYNDGATSVAERADIRSSGVTFKNLSTGLFIGAGVAAVTTAVLFFFTDFKGGERKSGVSAAPTPGGAFVAWDARF